MGVYSANYAKASLKVPESRIIAGLLLDHVDEATWLQAVTVDNVLQKRSPLTARSFAQLIRDRLRTANADLWRLVRDGSPTVATQAVLATAIKHSRLLGDFLDLAVRDQLRQFKATIADPVWGDFIAGCISRDARVATWTPPVVAKLRQNTFRILAEAGYVEDTRGLRLQRVTVVPEVARYLAEENEQYVLRAMRVAE